VGQRSIINKLTKLNLLFPIPLRLGNSSKNMNKKIFIGLIAVVVVIISIISITALYLAIVTPAQLQHDQNEVTQKINSEMQILKNVSTPYVYAGNPVGYVIDFENGAKFYFAGDTALTYDMKFVVGDYYKVDAAFLPIGDVYTMGPDSAAFAASVINPEGLKVVVPIHYGKTSCPMVNADVNDFTDSLIKYGVQAEPAIFALGEEKDILGIKVLFLGGASWLFTTPNGNRIFVDPSMQFNGAILERFKDVSQFERVDLVLLTHAHFDHMSVQDIQQWSKAYDPIFVAPYELGVLLSGYIDSPVLSINAGGKMSMVEWRKTSFDPKRYEKFEGMTFHLVHAFHSSVMTPAGVNSFAADQYIME